MKKEKTKASVQKKLSALAIKQAEPPEEVSETQLQEAFVEPKSQSKLSKALLIAGASLAVVAIAMFSVLIASRYSLATVYLGSTPVKATQSPAQLQQQISSAAANYQLKLHYLNGKEKNFPLSATGISVNAPASAAAAKKQLSHSFGQRLTWWRPIHLQLITMTDKVKLDSFITTKATVADKPSKNAGLSIKNGSVVLVPERAGTGSTVKNAKTSLLATVSRLSNQPLKLEPAQLEPSITSQDLESSQTKAETILAQKVNLTINGHFFTASPTDIGGWLEFTPVPSAKTVDVTVNSGKVVQYINRIAGPYIQPPRSRLVMKTHNGLTVLDAGASGVDVLKKNQTAANIAQAVTNGEAYNAILPVAYAAFQTVEVKPAPKWIIVDTTTKRMYAYEQTRLVKTFLVSAGAPYTPTVLGKFAIYSKFVKQDMRGGNADGSRYYQPDVPYVNYFYRDYAIHGNYWRPLSYFGNINSSHGCVGITVSDGAWMYRWAPVGTPVIIHA